MLSLILALALADPPAEPKSADTRPPADISRAVDANGVPAWARRQRKEPVQACPTKPNIGIETWRERYETTGTNRLKPRPDMNTCR